MSILKTNWATGDVVTADKLNAMQYAVVTSERNEETGNTEINATAKDLYDTAMQKIVIFVVNSGTSEYGGGAQVELIGGVSYDVDSGYTFSVYTFSGTVAKPVTRLDYYASSDDAHPAPGMS